ncbi:MAG: ABC-three component system middle component 4 [Arcobacter sp.]|uniref:ABC-three component system middle component 4 n=1 Tax=Arcobacter sp. TaxID=1872629 RepID=UPI003C77FA4C
MNNLPYYIPDYELDLNLSLLVIVLHNMERTKRGKLIVNNENLIFFIFLIKNPSILNNLLYSTNNGKLNLDNNDIYNIETISNHTDFLYDSKWLKLLLQSASQKEIIVVSYRKDSSFVYSLTEKGTEIYDNLSENNYFQKIQQFAFKMRVFQQYKTKDLNNMINNFKESINE